MIGCKFRYDCAKLDIYHLTFVRNRHLLKFFALWGWNSLAITCEGCAPQNPHQSEHAGGKAGKTPAMTKPRPSIGGDLGIASRLECLREFGGRDQRERGAQCARLLRAECGLEAVLSLLPEAHRLAELGLPELGQLDQSAAFVLGVHYDGDKPVPCERLEIVSKGGPIQHQCRSQLAHRRRSGPSDVDEDRTLGRTQPTGYQNRIIELGDAARRLAKSGAVAKIRWGKRHRVFLFRSRIAATLSRLLPHDPHASLLCSKVTLDQY